MRRVLFVVTGLVLHTSLPHSAHAETWEEFKNRYCDPRTTTGHGFCMSGNPGTVSWTGWWRGRHYHTGPLDYESLCCPPNQVATGNCSVEQQRCRLPGQGLFVPQADQCNVGDGNIVAAGVGGAPIFYYAVDYAYGTTIRQIGTRTFADIITSIINNLCTPGRGGGRKSIANRGPGFCNRVANVLCAPNGNVVQAASRASAGPYSGFANQTAASACRAAAYAACLTCKGSS